MPLFDAVAAHMDFSAAGSDAWNFLAQAEVEIVAQYLGSVDGIVIGDCHQVHAAPLEGFINGPRVVVALAADSAQQRDVAHAGVPRVNVQIAPHDPLYSRF